ncbi:MULTISPECIES: response regulator transcription factor [unclassified Dehalobacter]|jgi:DNA-binding NarL/FixJ family response regulator|uniref:response regulator n=1 Tax=unclassified Dehalobacter TaxID=2635733 RepID=UPI000E6C5447|nr:MULTISPECIES: response regulator transcription factor [unclassified Dehalobacter]RJE49100.1 DNA-binding response regulator [Dehalobacter sp. MCB1]TCX47206.1 DNA-binding response regulator [Dehalobacter sp. 14DCB1]TCX55334.1 DNA-binding response regulator [Dehalobacter sp. 12DCB1]
MKIVIVDDHPLVRQGLEAVLSTETDMTIVGKASNAGEAVDLICSVFPDIVLVDLMLSGSSGLDVIKTCKEKVSTCKYIVLTSSVSQDDFQTADQIGADGYILKEAFPEELISAIRLIYRGRKFYDPLVIEFMMKKETSNSMQQLTSRERDVLITLSEGLSNKEIAKKLVITEFTVKKHVSQILAKLELADRTQAALYARDHGLGNSR